MNTLDDMTKVRENVWHTPAADGSTLIVERMPRRDEGFQYVVTSFTPASGHYLLADGETLDEAIAAVAARV